MMHFNRFCMMHGISLIFFFLILPAAHSSSIHVDVSPQEVWIKNGSVSITLNCTSAGSVIEAFYSISSPIATENITMNEKEQGIFASEFSTLPYIGRYEGTAYCKVNESGNISLISTGFEFEVKDFVIASVSFEPSPAYTDDVLKLVVNTTVVGTISYSPASGVSFALKLDGEDVGISREDYYFYNGKWYIVLPSNLSAGKHVLDITAQYDGMQSFSTVSTTIYTPLIIDAFDVSGKIAPGNNITLRASVKFKGDAVSLQDVNPTLFLAGQDVSDLAVIKGDEDLVLTLPDRQPGNYMLRLEVIYSGHRAYAYTILSYPALFSLSFKTAENKALSGRIRFRGDDYEFSTSISGDAELLLPPSYYDIQLSDLPGIKNIQIRNVDMTTGAEEFLKYDVLDSGFGMEGIRLAGGIAIEIALPFTSASIEMKYDSRKVGDEELLVVYACHKWNFYARKCSGTWERIDAEVDTIRDVVRFTTNRLSAFVVGEPRYLVISTSLNKREVHLSEEFVVSGVVRNEDKSPVGYAKVHYRFDGTSGELEATKDGVFILRLRAPSEEGNYTVELVASKGFYLEARTGLNISVVAKKELSIILPDSFTVEVGSNTTLPIKVVNTGQKALSEVRIAISGLPAGSYRLDDAEISDLGVDEMKVLNLMLMPSEGQEGDYPVTFTVASKIDRYSKSSSMLVKYKKKSTINQIKALASSSKKSDASVLTSLTSRMVSAVNSLSSQIVSFPRVVVAGLLFTLALLISRREWISRKYNNQLKRREIISSLEGIRLEIEKEKERQKTSAFVCEKCDQRFHSKRAYSIHKAKAHGGR